MAEPAGGGRWGSREKLSQRCLTFRFMVCLACRGLVRPPGPDLCSDCRVGLTRGPVRRTPGGLTVVAAFAHRGPARTLVHRLKYEGLAKAAQPLAAGMSDLLPMGAVLVPVPRAMVRAIRYGIDPALTLAEALAPAVGGTIEPVLAAPVWAPRRAGRRGRPARAPTMRSLRRLALAGPYIVDDVVTTGATIDSAREALGGVVVGAVTATGAPSQRSTLRR